MKNLNAPDHWISHLLRGLQAATLFALASMLLLSCAQPNEAVRTDDTTGREAFIYVSSAERPELQGITSVTVSPDGRHLYTTAFQAGTVGIFRRDENTGILQDPTFMTDSANLQGAVAFRLTRDGRRAVVTAFRSQTVSLFARDPSSGALTLLGRARNGQNGVVSMNWPIDAAFSPDGRFLYVISGREPGSLSVFAVSDEGELSWVEGSTGRDGSFSNARGIALSPDGEAVYIASSGAGTLTVLDRDADTGSVSIKQILRDGQEANGLAGAVGVASSTDGRHVYVSSGRFGGDNAVSVFARQADGTLQLVQELIGERSGLDPFAGGNEILLSPEGRHVFVAGTLSGTVAHLSRDPETGMLIPLQMLYQGTDGAAGLEMGPRGEILYVAAENERSVAIYRRTSALTGAVSAPGLTERRQAMRLRAKLDSTWAVLRDSSLEKTARDSLQHRAAAEAFDYYLEHPETDLGKDAARQAFMMWGNVGADQEVERALAQIDPDSDIWETVLLFAGSAFGRADRYDDYLSLLRRLEGQLSHPKSRTMLYMRLGEYYARNAPDSARAYFERVVTLEADSFQVERARQNLYELAALQVGHPAPDFEATDLHGQTVRLSDLRGKVVLLDFWATWCGPCLPEIPHLKNLYEEYRDDDFALVGISLDTEVDSLRAFVQEQAMPWVQIGGSKGWKEEIAQSYNVHAIPMTYLIDADGRIAAKNLRGKEMEKTVRALLAGTYNAD